MEVTYVDKSSNSVHSTIGKLVVLAMVVARLNNRGPNSSSLIKEFNVPMLHVLFVLLHGAVGVALRGKGNQRVARRPTVAVELDVNVNRVGNRTEPLGNLLFAHLVG